MFFEKQYLKANECAHKQVEHVANSKFKYHVWRVFDDRIMHQVTFHDGLKLVNYTCRMYSEVGILCQRALKVFIVHSVNEIPTIYIIKRWTKEAMCMQQGGLARKQHASIPPTVWRSSTSRKFVSLVNSSYSELTARDIIDEAYNAMVQKLKDICSY